MLKKIPVIIDTDPGIDDAVALAAAFACDKLDIKLISTVSGNVGIENTSSNALKLVEFFNKDIKVSKGAEKPLIKECEHAPHIHGESGMDGYDFPKLKKSVYEKNSVEEMCIRDSIKVAYHTTEELDAFINEIQKFGNTETQIVFSTAVEHRGINLSKDEEGFIK